MSTHFTIRLAAFAVATACSFSVGTAMTHADTTTIAVIGDFGTGDQAEEQAAAFVHDINPDFVVGVGDANYGQHSTAGYDAAIGQFYCRYLKPYNGNLVDRKDIFGVDCESAAGDRDIGTFFVTPGNHDEKDNRYQAFQAYLQGNFTTTRYAMRQEGSIRFYSINSDGLCGETEGSVSESDLDDWLEGLLERDDAGDYWHIFFFHHPLLTTGDHGACEELEPVWDEIKDVSLEDQSLLLAGHNHIYERIQVRNPDDDDDKPLLSVTIGISGSRAVASDASSTDCCHRLATDDDIDDITLSGLTPPLCAKEKVGVVRLRVRDQPKSNPPGKMTTEFYYLRDDGSFAGLDRCDFGPGTPLLCTNLHRDGRTWTDVCNPS